MGFLFDLSTLFLFVRLFCFPKSPFISVCPFDALFSDVHCPVTLELSFNGVHSLLTANEDFSEKILVCDGKCVGRHVGMDGHSLQYL